MASPQLELHTSLCKIVRLCFPLNSNPSRLWLLFCAVKPYSSPVYVQGQGDCDGVLHPQHTVQPAGCPREPNSYFFFFILSKNKLSLDHCMEVDNTFIVLNPNCFINLVLLLTKKRIINKNSILNFYRHSAVQILVHVTATERPLEAKTQIDTNLEFVLNIHFSFNWYF